LSRNAWPEPEKQPYCVKHPEIWCKKLEFLVITYLNMLVAFSAHHFGKQIGAIAQKLTNQSEWSVMVHQLMQKLLTLDPDAREDERVRQIFELAEQLSGAGK
jgi:hypothetical protein